MNLDDPSHIGKEQEDAERDAMLNEAGYIVLRFTEIPSIRQLHKQLITPAMRIGLNYFETALLASCCTNCFSAANFS